MRIAVVTPIPTPYRDPFWNVVAGRPEVDQLDVFYCARGKADRPWEADWEMRYHAEFLPGRNLLSWRSADASCFWNPGIRRRLREGRYDAILVGGYNHPTMLAAVRESMRLGVPYYLMCETWSLRRGSLLKRAVKDWLVRWVVGNAAGTLPTGTLAERYLLHYGADPGTMTRIPNVPDVQRFARAKPRELLEFEGRGVVLFAARLIAKKRPELLIRAFHRTCREHDAVLVIVGDGPLRSGLAKLVTELGIAERVRFVGFVSPGEMPGWYARADVFVLPSSETWGVSVIEALASGTPVIVSDEVGCHPDVVIDAACGEVVRAGDEEALAGAIWRRCRASQRVTDGVRGEIESRFGYAGIAGDLCRAVGGLLAVNSRLERKRELCLEN